MPVTCTQDNRHLIISISGELDHHAAKTVMLQLQSHIDAARPSHLTLDLQSLTFTDSSGIAVLLRTWRQAQSLSATMQVTHVPPQADKVFRAAGLHRIIPFQ